MRCKDCLPRVWGCAVSRSGGKDRPLGIAPAVPPVPPSRWAPVKPAAWVFFPFPNNWSPGARRGEQAWRAGRRLLGLHTCRKAGQPLLPLLTPPPPPTLRQQSGRAFLNQRRLLLHIPTPTVTVCRPRSTHPHSDTAPKQPLSPVNSARSLPALPSPSHSPAHTFSSKGLCSGARDPDPSQLRTSLGVGSCPGHSCPSPSVWDSSPACPCAAGPGISGREPSRQGPACPASMVGATLH